MEGYNKTPGIFRHTTCQLSFLFIAKAMEECSIPDSGNGDDGKKIEKGIQEGKALPCKLYEHGLGFDGLAFFTLGKL